MKRAIILVFAVSITSTATIRAQARLVVHLGATDGDVEIGQSRDGNTLVHSLTADQKIADALRARIAKANLASIVRIDVVKDWQLLPYPDRFVHMLIADFDAIGARVPTAEIERVMVPGGRILTEEKGQFVSRKMPRSTATDDWTHKWYDATGNPVSKDQLAGPPTAVQWAHGPAFADRSVGGKTPRIANGIFVCVDSVDGNLFARDAGAGLPLWRADLKLSDTADFNIADGKIFVHVEDALGTEKNQRNRGESGPLVVLDLATGQRLGVFDQGIQNKKVQGMSASSIAQTVLRDGAIVQAVAGELCVLEAKDGKRRWHHQLKNGVYFAPIVLDGAVIVAECDEPVKRARLDNSNSARALTAFALADGKPLWRTDKVLPPWVTEEIRGVKVTQRPSLSPIVGAEGMVFLHGGSYQARAPGAFVAGVSATDGKELWRQIIVEKDWNNTVEASRLVVREGAVYYLGGKGIRVYDAKTGEPRTDFLKRPRYAFNGFGECSGSRATTNWLIANGLCYWDRDLKLTETWAARSACGTGVFPANGMIYALPTGCDCISYSRGYLGMSSSPLPAAIPDEQRLVRTPGWERDRKDSVKVSDWPIFLGNPQRMSLACGGVADKLGVVWKTHVAERAIGAVAEDRRRSEYWIGPLTAPVVGGKFVVVAGAESGEVVALDTESGEKKWSFLAGAQVDSAPTIHRGLVCFGSHDGWVYALDHHRGELVWKFQAAPIDRKAMLHGQLTSAFPVHGSVLPLEDKLLVTAGFHNYLGGLHAWVLDVSSGKIEGKSTMQGGPTMLRPVVNDILCASADNKQGWLALDAGLGLDGQPRSRTTKLGQPILEGTGPLMVIDRSAALVRFPHDQRGGSTHGWSRPMSAGGARGQRIAFDGQVAFALADPTENQNHPVVAPKAVVLSAIEGATHKDRKDLWQATAESLGKKESYSAIVKAGSRLYLGGGRRDGSAGFVQVVSAADGKLLHEIALPARVTECGIAVAGGKLYASCENGDVVCVGGP